MGYAKDLAGTWKQAEAIVEELLPTLDSMLDRNSAKDDVVLNRLQALEAVDTATHTTAKALLVDRLDEADMAKLQKHDVPLLPLVLQTLDQDLDDMRDDVLRLEKDVLCLQELTEKQSTAILALLIGVSILLGCVAVGAILSL